PAAVRARGRLYGEAPGDGRFGLRRGGGRRGVRADQSPAQAGAGGLHPARLQRARARHERRAPGSARACARGVRRPQGRALRGREDRFAERRPGAELGRGPGSRRRAQGAPRDRRGHGGDPLHVAQHLENRPEDRILAALPLSFDAGFSQLTTAFHVGASVALINYLVPRDVVEAIQRHRITGLTAVPPLWIQLASLKWPDAARHSLRYIANTGGRMPRATLDALRALDPQTLVFLMYGLTESFRSTYLPPSE